MIFAVVGPSGAGKDTLMSAACARDPSIRLVRRVITRPADAGGEDFESVSEAAFQARKQAGAFALDWDAHGLRYAIPADQLTGPGTVLFNGSRKALSRACTVLPDLTVILVTAPLDVLAQRLAQRGREDAQDILGRLARSEFVLPAGIIPRVVVNDTTEAEGVRRFMAALYPVSGTRSSR
jgi:ribose 1,5-bisphosphokinase